MTRRTLTQMVAPPLAVVVLWVGAVWYPTTRSEDSASRQLEDTDRQSTVQLDRLAALRQIAAIGDEVASRELSLVEALPAEGNLGVVVASFDTVAQVAGIQIKNLTPSRVDETRSSELAVPLPGGVASIAFRLTATGSYQSVLDFLDGLTTMRRLLIVDDLSVFARAQEPDVLNVTLDVRVFTKTPVSEASPTALIPETLAFDEGPTSTVDAQNLPPVLTWDPPLQRRNPFVRIPVSSARELLHQDTPDRVASAE